MVDLGTSIVTPPGKKKGFFARLFGEDVSLDVLELTKDMEDMAAPSITATKAMERMKQAEERIRRMQMAVPSAQDQYNNMMGAQNALQGTLGGQSGLLGGMGNYNGNAATPGPVTYSVMEKLLMRMNVPRNQTHEFDYLQAVDNPSKENVIVFLIVRGEPITLEDERAMFPSDGLVARINLLRK